MGPYYAASIDEPLVGLYLLWALSISRQEFGHGSPSCVQVIHGEEMSCVEVLKSPSTGSRTIGNLASDRILAPGRLLGVRFDFDPAGAMVSVVEFNCG
jgi:hypothetical protein